MKCEHCSATLAEHLRYCPGCQRDIGFPNVRMAGSQLERDALKSRVHEVMTFATARKSNETLTKFGEAVLNSKAVLCKSIGFLINFFQGETKLYVSFYQQLRSNARIPEDNRWDEARQSVDAKIFPYFFEEIICAALSLNDVGVLSYGDCSMVLKNNAIEHRTTAFEENPILFIKRQRIVATDPMPSGYRALWFERDQLAIAKLASKINTATKDSDFPAILISEGDASNGPDFIEAHIYGSIHPDAIEKVVIRQPKTRPKPDIFLIKRLESILKKKGIPMEIKS